MKVQDLPTPALCVDLDLFEANLARMQECCSRAGKMLRPHAKAHKRTAIALRQMELGAVGACAATIEELEKFSDVLLTTPVASPVKTARVAAHVLAGAAVTVVIDHPIQAKLYSDSALRYGVSLEVLADLDIGDHRTGVPCDERAVALVQTIAETPGLRFGGLQAYSVSGSHTAGWKERRNHSSSAIGQAIAVQRELLSRGFDARRLTGGSTGTWDIDTAIPEMTEIQAGSYPLMDLAYRRIGGVPFAAAMTVRATVVSASHPGRVTVDAGFKAFSTDRPFGPEAPDWPDTQWQWAGDEHGFLLGPELPGLGQQVAFLPPHCDPTVNLHAKIHACRGDEVVEVWDR